MIIVLINNKNSSLLENNETSGWHHPKTSEKIVFCPKNIQKLQKKPTDQARKLDTVGFLKADYLTASFYKGYTS